MSATRTSVTPTEIGSPQRWWGLTVLCIAVGILALDTTVLNFAIPAITTALQPSATQILWIVDVYPFVLAAFLVTMGTLGDRLGHRSMLLYGAMAFGVASGVAGFASSAEFLIAARAVQGATAATLMPATLSLIRELFPNSQERARAVAIWVAIYAVGAALGPLVGGILLQYFPWGSVLVINVPLVLILVIGGLCFLPKDQSNSSQPFDLFGALLSIIALFSLVYVVKTIPIQGPNLSSLVLGAVAVVVGWLFLHHLRHSSHPLLDVSLLANPTFGTVVLLNGVSMFLYIGVLFYFSQYLQVLLGFSSVVAGLLMLPGLVMSMLASLATGYMMMRFPARQLLIVALLLTMLASGILAADAYGLVADSGLWLAIGFAVFGLGVGMIDPITNDYILASVPSGRSGAAASISETGYELGGAFGTAILGSVLMAVYSRGVPEQFRDSLATAHAVGDADVIALADAAFRNGVIASSALAIVTAASMLVLVAWWLPRESTSSVSYMDV